MSRFSKIKFLGIFGFRLLLFVLAPILGGWGGHHYALEYGTAYLRGDFARWERLEYAPDAISRLAVADAAGVYVETPGGKIYYALLGECLPYTERCWKEVLAIDSDRIAFRVGSGRFGVLYPPGRVAQAVRVASLRYHGCAETTCVLLDDGSLWVRRQGVDGMRLLAVFLPLIGGRTVAGFAVGLGISVMAWRMK
jgi:hypothetical protein